VFHDGAETDGTWSREGLASRTTFADASGEPIKLTRGATWIAVVANGTPLDVTPGPG